MKYLVQRIYIILSLSLPCPFNGNSCLLKIWLILLRSGLHMTRVLSVMFGIWIMISALAAVSFLCSVVLSLFIVLHCVRRNIPRLALVSWLLGCNMVHGVDASIWASNVDPRALVWCDLGTKFLPFFMSNFLSFWYLVTKLVLATNIAVSGACLCIAHHLELVSSSRNLPDTPKAFRNRRLSYLIICYLIPLLYMALRTFNDSPKLYSIVDLLKDIVGQDHRFDLVQGIGCYASVHPSVVASLVVWFPQALMCILSFVLYGEYHSTEITQIQNSLTVLGIAVHNSSRHCFPHFSGHLESRSQMNSSTWLRMFSISMAITVINSLVILFSVLSLPMSDSWISWQHVHLHLSEVFIVTEKRQIAGIEINWWGLRVITICYIFLVLILGEEGRVIIGHLREGAQKISLGVPSLIAPR